MQWQRWAGQQERLLPGVCVESGKGQTLGTGSTQKRELAIPYGALAPMRRQKRMLRNTLRWRKAHQGRKKFGRSIPQGRIQTWLKKVEMEPTEWQRGLLGCLDQKRRVSGLRLEGNEMHARATESPRLGWARGLKAGAVSGKPQCECPGRPTYCRALCTTGTTQEATHRARRRSPPPSCSICSEGWISR